MPVNLEDRSKELLKGAMDTHIHSAPDIYPRSVTVIEAARNAQAAGMKAILVKSHCTDTSDRAEIARELTGFPVYGGVTLNYSVGGLNIHAVRECIRQGGKQVWMPSTSAPSFLKEADSVPHLAKSLPVGVAGLTILDGDGRLLPEIPPILSLIAQADIALATSHISPREGLALVRAARDAGIRRITVTHPHAAFLGYTVDQMSELGRMGAMVEMHYNFVTAMMRNPTGLSDLARMIRQIGPERCIMATDGGQAGNPPPHESLRRFIAGVLEAGFTEDEIRMMTVRNPGVILNLS
ncbi:MAG TPA: DUF6282 family protein [Thermodesulfobacteriota bacterium]|nr:DUF6282 family protein [Thermodesulfobacteriota bacterium]